MNDRTKAVLYTLHDTGEIERARGTVIASGFGESRVASGIFEVDEGRVLCFVSGKEGAVVSGPYCYSGTGVVNEQDIVKMLWLKEPDERKALDIFRKYFCDQVEEASKTIEQCREQIRMLADRLWYM